MSSSDERVEALAKAIADEASEMEGSCSQPGCFRHTFRITAPYHDEQLEESEGGPTDDLPLHCARNHQRRGLGHAHHRQHLRPAPAWSAIRGGEPMSNYIDEWGTHFGFCNSCGEEAPLDSECCESGEVVQYEDDEVEF